MASSWYLYSSSAPQLNNSGYEREEFNNYAQEGFWEIVEESFLTDPPIRVYFGNGLDESTAKDIKAIVQNNTTDSPNQDYIRQIIAPIGELKMGMYVRYKGDIYLINNYIGDNQIYQKSIMFLCNYNLRWLNYKGEEVERPIWRQDSTRFSSGESANQEMVTGNVRNEIIMPKDLETIHIRRDMRIILDDYDACQILENTPQVYKITKENRILSVQNGWSIFSFIVSEDSFNVNTDNREKLIADYYPDLVDYKVELLTNANIQIQQGQTLQISYVLKADGVEVNELPTFYSNDEAIIEVSEIGLITGIAVGASTIEVSFHHVIATINVTVVSVPVVNANTCKITYVGMPDLKVGGSQKTYTANFYDYTGAIISPNAVWSIYDNANNPVSYIQVMSQTVTQIQLKCINDLSLIGTEVFLKLTDSGNTCQEVLTIPIVSLI